MHESSSDAVGHLPCAIYRLQFNREFTFRDATALVPYLDALGISTLYASPYLQARPGSLHGYDVFDHNALNPEIGSPEDHNAMSRALREHGMGQMLDIVPNHMGIGDENRWWMDVLENGPSSPFAPYFDIDWQRLQPGLAGKVLLPVLGDQFGQVLERGELQLRNGNGRFTIRYHEHEFPVAPKSAAAVLRLALTRLPLPGDHPDSMELESIVTALEHLPPRDKVDAASVAERRRETVVAQRRLAGLCASSAEASEALTRAVEEFNGTPGEPRSFDPLERLLDDQAYRLAFWRVATEEINYRRFFDINDLAGVRVERPEVFEEVHRLIFRFIEDSKVTSLRVDHPDGLFDPPEYLRDLQNAASRRTADPPVYIAVEKILTGEEELPPRWPVAGTVGYEFLNRLNGLFVAQHNEAEMNEVYAWFVPRPPEFTELIYRKKKLILRVALASELNVLSQLLNRLSEEQRRSRDFTLNSLTDALREAIACFPVYRTYIDARAGRVADSDRDYIDRAIREAKRRNRTVSASIFDFVGDTLLLRWPDSLDRESREEHARFVMKFQQLTGPVMAKGVEDTAFYIYNRLVSLNEVGGEPEVFGTSPDEFHRWIAERAEEWPHAMNSTSTHDTKRSEDVRARINVLSEIPERWTEHALRWTRLNAPHRHKEDGQPIPDRNDEYLLYQTLVGAWPAGGLDPENRAMFVERIQGYMEKATREAKVHSSWINPNEVYDAGLRKFVAAILDHGQSKEFLNDFEAFHPRIARCGMLNSLAQTLVKLTCPGVPDIYRGQELWDFSLVDPDNRRPVDFQLREQRLNDLRERLRHGDRATLARALLDDWRDGRVKMFVTHLALELRRARSELFAHGSYLPLRPSGQHADHLVAFAREHGTEQIVTVVPRLVATLTRHQESSLPLGDVWEDTRIAGAALTGRYRDVFTGEVWGVREQKGGRSLDVGDILAEFPVALLERA